MKTLPLESLPFDQIRAVFTDLDDTLTTDGQMQEATYQWLWRLKAAGLWLVIVSGRPAGWADCLMRLWPLDAMVFENGAGVLVRGKDGPNVISLAPEHYRAKQQKRLEEVWLAVQKAVPRAKLASDQSFRLFDYAVDFAEDAPHLDEGEIAAIESVLKTFPNITYKVSSIHINYWVGSHTKITACEYLLKEQGPQWKTGRDQVLFTGDSPNDEPLFAFFPHSVGVANLKPFLPRLTHPPRYLTPSPRGEGFAEACRGIIAAQTS